jgi:hypothetical protein
MRTPLLVTTLLFFTALAACKETPPATTTTATPTPTATPTTPTTPTATPTVAGAPDERVTAADQQCTQDSECALTTADCCGCTSLGKQIGVRADVVAALAQRRAPVCASVSCAQAMSDDPSCSATKAVCKAGKCEPDVAGAPTGAPTMKPTPVEPIPPG